MQDANKQNGQVNEKNFGGQNEKQKEQVRPNQTPNKGANTNTNTNTGIQSPDKSKGR